MCLIIDFWLNFRDSIKRRKNRFSSSDSCCLWLFLDALLRREIWFAAEFLQNAAGHGAKTSATSGETPSTEALIGKFISWEHSLDF